MGLLFDWFGIRCMTAVNFCFYLQNRLIQTSQPRGQLYNHTSPFRIPWFLTQKLLQLGLLFSNNAVAYPTGESYSIPHLHE